MSHTIGSGIQSYVRDVSSGAIARYLGALHFPLTPKGSTESMLIHRKCGEQVVPPWCRHHSRVRFYIHIPSRLSSPLGLPAAPTIIVTPCRKAITNGIGCW